MTTIEQQIAAIMAGSSINTMQITAVREDDGVTRFYTTMHGNEGGCVFSALRNLPTVREAINSGIDALNKSRMSAVNIGEIAPMAEVA